MPTAEEIVFREDITRGPPHWERQADIAKSTSDEEA